MSVLHQMISLVKGMFVTVIYVILWREVKRFADISHWYHPRRRRDRLLILVSFLSGLVGTALVENVRISSFFVPNAIQHNQTDNLAQKQGNLPIPKSGTASVTFPTSDHQDKLDQSKVTVTIPSGKPAFSLKKPGPKVDMIDEEGSKSANIPLPIERPDFSNQLHNNQGSDIKKLAIVIDDLGMDRHHTNQVIDLPGPLTLAFLPYAQNLSPFLSKAHKRQHEIIVHFPMQPKGSANPGPHALKTSMGIGQLYQEILWNLSQFEGYVGMNNHMGSLFTENEFLMSYVIFEVARRKIYFLDSQTTPNSVGRRLSKKYGVPFAQRDIFLDNLRTLDAVNLQLRQAERILQKYHQVIVIGHPYKVTIQGLKSWIKALPKNVKMVPVSDLLIHYPPPQSQEVESVFAAPGRLY